MPIDLALEEKVLASLRANDTPRAAEALLRGYGPELYGFLLLRLPEQDADDAFAMASEDVWRGLPQFRGECSLRTWAYRLARHAAARLLRGDGRRKRRMVEGGTDAADKIAWEVRTGTKAHEKTAAKEELRRMMAQLSDEEQELVVLRVKRELDFNDIARICGSAEDADTVRQQAAAYRKRWERVKAKLVAMKQKQEQ